MSARIRSQLANMAKQAKAVLGVDKLEAVADRGYFNGEEIKACDDAGITVTLPKPHDVGRQIGRPFRQAGFRLSGRRGCLSLPGRREADAITIPTEENGQKLRRYWTNACRTLPAESSDARRATSAASRAGSTSMCSRPCRSGSTRIRDAMRTRRETVEHPFGTLKMRMGATHFLCKTLPKVATEMALCVLGYNLTRVHQHRRRRDDDGGDPGVREFGFCALRVDRSGRSVRPRSSPVDSSTRYSKNMLRPSCRRGSSPVACSFWGRKNVFTQSGPVAAEPRHR